MTSNDVISRCILAGGIYIFAFVMFVMVLNSCATRKEPDLNQCPFCGERIR